MTTRSLPRPNHLSLGELIERLQQERADKRVAVGFASPCSYRGYYEQCAVVITGPTTVHDMLTAAKTAVGATYGGWKGGDYEMGDYTEVWLVDHPGSTGESLGAVLLELLLANEVTA